MISAWLFLITATEGYCTGDRGCKYKASPRIPNSAFSPSGFWGFTIQKYEIFISNSSNPSYGQFLFLLKNCSQEYIRNSLPKKPCSLHLIWNFREVPMLGIWSFFIISGKCNVLPEGNFWPQIKEDFEETFIKVECTGQFLIFSS